MQDAGAVLDELAAQLASQNLYTQEELDSVLRLPAKSEVEQMLLLSALWWMIRLDLARPFALARLRRKRLSVAEAARLAGGLLPSHHERIERIIRTVRKRASLGKRALFLQRTQQVFHLWHVVHRPFSYSFVVLATIHIVVAMLFGFM